MARTRFSGPIGVGRRATPNQADLLRDSDIRGPGRPGGWTQAYIFAAHQAGHAFDEDATGGILTGDGTALRVRAENRIASMTGGVRAIQAQASNNAASSGGTAQALYAETLAQGVDLGTLRGAEIIADNSLGTGTITTMVGARIRVVGAGTVTNGPWGLQIINDSESAQASAAPLKALIRCESAVVTTVNSCVIDVTDARINGAALYSVTLTADDNVLFYYKDKDGTAHAVVVGDDDALAVRSP